MMRRFVKTVSAVLAGCAALVSLVSLPAAANAQEIQLTGPLAGAPAGRYLRLHRAGRFEVALGSSFTLLDQYLRTAMPGATLTYHFTDWIGVGVFGGYGFQSTTGLTDELQTQAVGGYNCSGRPFTTACQLTAVNLTHGNLANDQLAHITWMVAPQVVAVPFRGKFSLFSSLFMDTDVDIFAGAAFIGLKERAECGKSDDGTTNVLAADGKTPLSCSLTPSNNPGHFSDVHARQPHRHRAPPSASGSISTLARRTPTSSASASSSAPFPSRGTRRASTPTAAGPTATSPTTA